MAQVFIDGVDVTGNCTVPEEVGGQPIEWHRRGGRPSTITLKGPSHLLGGTLGVSSVVMTGIGAGFTGTLWRRDDEGNEDDCWSTLLAADQSIYFPKRIVKDGADIDDPITGEPDPGNFSDPSIIGDFLYGPSIFAAAIDHSISLDGEFGPLGLSVGGVTLGDSIDLTGFRPTNWPMTIDQLRALLSNAGVLAYRMLGTGIHLYEGAYLAGEFVNQPFDYGTGVANCSGAKRSLEMENVFNVVWDFLGPKEPLYDGDIQHWRGNVTIDDSPLGTPDGGYDYSGTPATNPNYGEYTGIPDPPFSAVAAQVLTSRDTYGRLQRVDEYDLYRDERLPAEKRNLRRIAQMLWLQKSLYCANPRQIVTMTPEKGVVPTFDVYDTIPVAAGSMLNGGFSGEQRVYEFKVGIDTEGNVQLKELQTSPNLG